MLKCLAKFNHHSAHPGQNYGESMEVKLRLRGGGGGGITTIITYMYDSAQEGQ